MAAAAGAAAVDRAEVPVVTVELVAARRHGGGPRRHARARTTHATRAGRPVGEGLVVTEASHAAPSAARVVRLAVLVVVALELRRLAASRQARAPRTAPTV